MAELTGAQLQRTCAPLYPSFALESFAALVLFFFFLYLSIIISTRQQLKTPAKSIAKLIWHSLTGWWEDTVRVLSRWSEMGEMSMPKRLRFCRRLNATICRSQAVIALLAVTRWLHINNVNGFRYLGYAFTCPLMQAELILIIAPIVPCYRMVTQMTAIITFLMLLSGYIASQFDGKLWEGDLVLDRNLSFLTTKGWVTLPSMVILLFLSFVQIPVLGLLYCWNGGGRDGRFPAGYLTLLAITSVTWLLFPIWWFLSFEGEGYIQDTKLNGAGFALLNMTSKGAFTMQMLSMVKRWKRDFGPSSFGRQTSVDSAVADLQNLSPRSNKTEKSADWIINGLKTFDQGSDNSLDRVPGLGPEAQAPPPPEKTIVLDTTCLSDEVLVSELARRINLSSVGNTDHIVGKPLDPQELFKQALDKEIAMACSKFACEDDDEDDEE
ncbi:unnamed protein product [Prorocentrum cordatum]|uniref:Uncharacterized protein n=1 Tax=Prorocentrum cordatum TaxID=2364126 RepID=A0ABN9QNH3_9DINO|nr:unnamed protein product [Polarella glacialis]